MSRPIREAAEERKFCGRWCIRIFGSLCFLFIAFMILASSSAHRDRLTEFVSINKAVVNADATQNGKCEKWQKMRAVACVWSDVIDLAYMLPYWAEHLDINYELLFLDKATDAEKKQAELERELGCALTILVNPRPGHADRKCTAENKELYDNAKLMREVSKEKQGDFKIKSKFMDKKWHDEVAAGDNWEPVRLTNSRPFMVKTKGEVFLKPIPEPDYDLVLFRALEAVGGTATAHFLQGVTLWYRKGEPAEGEPSATSLVQHGEQLEEDYFRKIMNTKKGFATIINGAVIKRCIHTIDAVLRFVVATMLNEKKPVHGLGHAKYLYNNSLVPHCAGRDLNSFNCMELYKFTISMENSRHPGYVSEKIINAKLANSVPIYFGASNPGDYFNPDAFVFCNVSAVAIEEIRTFEDRSGKFPKVLSDLNEEAEGAPSSRFCSESTADKSGNAASDMQLMRFVRKHVGKELISCVNEVMRLDGDDEAYLKMLAAPMYRDNKYHKTMADGYVVGRGVADLIRDLKG